jgi:hypothetical protein
MAKTISKFVLRLSSNSDSFLFHSELTKKSSELVVTYYTDLSTQKDMVLFKGDFHGEALTYRDGVSLMQTSALFYLQDEWYEQFVVPFTNHKFDFNAMAKKLHNLHNTPHSQSHSQRT